MVVCPGRLTVLKAPAIPRSAADNIHPARSRASMSWSGRSGGPGATTRPPRASRCNHHGNRPTFSYGPRMRPAGPAGHGRELFETGQLGSPLARGVVVVLCAFGVGVDGRASSHPRRSASAIGTPSGRHVAVVPDLVVQQSAATRDDGRRTGPGVDHRIPAPSAEASFQLLRRCDRRATLRHPERPHCRGPD